MRFFVQRYNARFRKQVAEGVSPDALEMLAAYWWPGNVRELENLVERLVAMSDGGGLARTIFRSSTRWRVTSRRTAGTMAGCSAPW